MSFSSPDSFSETTSESWLGRLGSSIKGVLVGLLLFVVGFPVLWWNEGRAVRTAQGLQELAVEVVSAPSEKVEPTNDGKPVHLSAQAESDETLTDPVFNVATKGIKLARRVAMYQWHEQKKSEKRKKLGGGTETITTYTYEKGWPGDSNGSGGSHLATFKFRTGDQSGGAVEIENSSQFKHPEGHENPSEAKYPNLEKVADKVFLGAFTLSPGLVGQLNQFEDLPLGEEDLSKISEEARKQVKLEGGGLYVGENPASPKVGDLRIKFSVVKPAVVSILAKQAGETFAPWQSQSGTSVDRLMYGSVDAKGMVQVMERENKMLTWILRLGGFLLMAFGIGLVLNPLVVVADVVPFVGNLLGMGVAVTAGLVAAVFSLVTIGVAWLAYRPVLGIGILLAAVAIVLLAKTLAGKRRAATAK